MKNVVENVVNLRNKNGNLWTIPVGALRHYTGILYTVNRSILTECLSIPHRAPSIDLCGREGGTCVKAGACTGWVERYDTSCGQDVCCKPAPTTANPEPPHPRK